jgi:Spy/CpxP family protein refolding chaperone
MLRNIKKILAIACVTMAVGAVTVPNLVSAQNTSTTPNSTEKYKRRFGDAMKQLNLTDVQKTELKKIYEKSKADRQNVLTPEQRAKMQQARQSGERKGVKNSLNLTDAQKQQMRAIGASTKTQVQNVLTAEQKLQLEKIRQERKSQRGDR